MHLSCSRGGGPLGSWAAYNTKHIPWRHSHMTKTHTHNHHHLPRLEWSVVETGGVCNNGIYHACLCLLWCVLRPMPWGGTPTLAKLGTVSYIHVCIHINWRLNYLGNFFRAYFGNFLEAVVGHIALPRAACVTTVAAARDRFKDT